MGLLIYLPASLIAVLLIHLTFQSLRRVYSSYHSSIPQAHWTSGVSSIWILWIRYTHKENQTIHEAHARLGPVIRLGPRDVSVNCIKGGVQTIYAGGFDKHEWYSNLFENYGVPNMFSTSESKPHAARKRMISNIYSKSYLLSSSPLKSITQILLFDRLIPRLHELAQQVIEFDILPIINASTMDFVTSYLFGISSSSDFLRNEKRRDAFLDNYTSRHAYTYYPQEIPKLTSYLRKVGIKLVPDWVSTANSEIEDWTLEMCDAAARIEVGAKDDGNEDIPEVHRQLNNAMERSSPKDAGSSPEYGSSKRVLIASEVLDHLAAGFDTSGITLGYFVHEISKRPDIQTALRRELCSLGRPVQSVPGKTSTLPSYKQLDALPLLQATLQETLRLRAAIPGPQPRITPPNGCHIGPNLEHHVPGHTRIAAQAHSLHRNPAVFPDPEAWLPERWLNSTDEQLKEMNRWFWAFGSGGRMCVGSNLAIYQMKYIIAAIYSTWRTVIVDDAGFEQRDLYTAPPTSGKLIVRLEKVTALD